MNTRDDWYLYVYGVPAPQPPRWEYVAASVCALVAFVPLVMHALSFVR